MLGTESRRIKRRTDAGHAPGHRKFPWKSILFSATEVARLRSRLRIFTHLHEGGFQGAKLHGTDARKNINMSKMRRSKTIFLFFLFFSRASIFNFKDCEATSFPSNSVLFHWVFKVNLRQAFHLILVPFHWVFRGAKNLHKRWTIRRWKMIIKYGSNSDFNSNSRINTSELERPKFQRIRAISSRY